MYRASCKKVLVILFLLAIESSCFVRTTVQADQSATSCDTCGAKLTYIILVEFSDKPHVYPPEHYNSFFSELNATYYEQSYHKMWLVGGIRGWIPLGKSTSAYAQDEIDKWEANDGPLIEDAMRITGYNDKNVFKIFVFSGTVWGFAFADIKTAGVDEETQVGEYAHEFGHLLTLPDLYIYGRTGPLGDPTNGLDVMASSYSPEFSSWSRIKLGWILNDWIYTVSLARLPTEPVTLDLLDDVNPETHTIKITWGPQQQYALVERRPQASYLFFVNDSRESGEGIVRYNATLTLHNIAIEDSYNFSVILVDEEKGRFVVGTVTMGETANQAIRSIDNAETALRAAWATNRLQGLKESNSTLQAAREAYSTMNFREAKQLADNANDLANKATASQAYYDAEQSIDESTRQIANATFTSPEADTLRLQAIRVLNNATVAFQQKRFDDAKSLAWQSLDLLKEARETEETSKYQMRIQWLTIGSTMAIVLALCAIVAIVLRKRSRI